MYVRTFHVWGALLTACLTVACADVAPVDSPEIEALDSEEPDFRAPGTETPSGNELVFAVATPAPLDPFGTEPAAVDGAEYEPVWGDSDPDPIADSPVPELLEKLVVTEISQDLPAYDRSDWRHWTDEDSDCQNTRAEILIRTSYASVTFTNDDECTVADGEWYDPFTGETFYSASDLDIDHMIPLKNAHLSGAHNWDYDRRRAFANDMDHYEHLVPTKSSVNSSKGARGPEAWRPPAGEYWCEYATYWAEIKVRWDLSVTAAEYDALAEMLETC